MSHLDKDDKGGYNPLLLAPRKYKLEVFHYLTKIGPFIDIRDVNRNTSLHFAVHSGNVEIINILLDKGMSVVLTNTYGCTPLLVSAKCGNLEATKSSVERGFPFDIADKDGDTPLLLAARYSKLEVFRDLTEKDSNIYQIKECLLTNGDDSTPLHTSANCGNLEATEVVFQRSAALNNANGMATLHCFCLQHIAN